MKEPVNKSVAKAGEIADIPESNEVKNFDLHSRDGEDRGYLISWETSIGAYIMAGSDSHVSLDANM